MKSCLVETVDGIITHCKSALREELVFEIGRRADDETAKEKIRKVVWCVS